MIEKYLDFFEILLIYLNIVPERVEEWVSAHIEKYSGTYNNYFEECLELVIGDELQLYVENGMLIIKYEDYLGYENGKVYLIYDFYSHRNLEPNFVNILGNHLSINKKTLSFSNNRRKLRDIYEITMLPLVKDLNLLNLSSNLLTEIKGLDHLTTLKTLIIRLNKLTKIQGLDNLHNLKTLDLSGNKISEIKGLENLHSLETLRIL